MGDSMLLNTRDAAAFLGVTENTLRQSRVAGKKKLRGVDPPKFVKTGHRSVMYSVSELARWKAQFESGGDSEQPQEPAEPDPEPEPATPPEPVKLNAYRTRNIVITGFIAWPTLDPTEEDCELQLKLF